MKRRTALGLGLAILLALPAIADDIPYAQQSPPQPGEEASQKRLSDLMASIQTRHLKLWYAGSLKNWPLAAFEAGQIKDGFIDAGWLYRNIPVEGIMLASKPIDALLDDIKNKNSVAFTKDFTALSTGCNACHQAAGVGFVVIKAPTASPFSNQEFAPTPQR